MNPWTTFAPLVERLGHIIARNLARFGIDALERMARAGIKRIRKRIRRYRNRLARADGLKKSGRLARRIKFHEWRINNRKRLLTWVAKHKEEMSEMIAKEMYEKAREIPEVGEHIGAWEAA